MLNFPGQGVCGSACTCVCTRACVLLSVSLRRGLCSQLRLSCPLDVLSGAEAVPGQAGKLAPGAPTAVRSQALSPFPREGPSPHFSLLGHGPVCRLLRSNPAKRLNQNQLFYACCLPLPATLLSLLRSLFRPSAPGYLLEVGFLRAPRPPRAELPTQGPAASPLPWSYQVSPPSPPFPDSENQLSTFLPSASYVLSSAVRPARGAALGGRLLSSPPSHQEGFGPS